MTSPTKYLYSGVNATLYTKLNGVLLPKVQQPFLASPRWGQSEWATPIGVSQRTVQLLSISNNKQGCRPLEFPRCRISREPRSMQPMEASIRKGTFCDRLGVVSGFERCGICS